MGTSIGPSDFSDPLGGQALLWLVDGIQGNHQPIICDACLPKQSQISLSGQLSQILLKVFGMKNKETITEFSFYKRLANYCANY